jgi:hypothetical protein
MPMKRSIAVAINSMEAIIDPLAPCADALMHGQPAAQLIRGALRAWLPQPANAAHAYAM